MAFEKLNKQELANRPPRKITRQLNAVSSAAVLIGTVFAFTAGTVHAEATVIELTQTPCQFVESELDGDLGYSSTNADDCKKINSENGEQRVDQADPIRLKPGSYIFRVTNKSVPYDLGFWLRGSGLVGKVKLPNVSGGGLTEGTTKDYVIDLVAGEYLYSCPLNPTPDYKLIVEE